MQNWLQRAAIWLAIGAFLSQLPVTWHSVALIMVLLFILEHLAAQQGARVGMELILNLPQQRLQRLQALFKAAALGAPVDEEAVRRILDKDDN
jgi:hypothetical protein